MKLTQTPSIKRKAGMTLIELTVVIVVLLALIAVLFIGARAYKKGADKSACIMAQRNVQQACRAYFNLNQSPDTATVSFAQLATAELLAAVPKCPATGTSFAALSGTAALAAGNLFAPCPDVGTTSHTPAEYANW